MKTQHAGFQSVLADSIRRFLAYKRALGRRYAVEEKSLYLLDQFLVDHQVRSIESISSSVIDAFLATRPRASARSYNHLLGVVRRLFGWLVRQGIVASSPVTAQPRRTTSQRIPFLFDRETAGRLLDLTSNFQDNLRATMRAQSYRTIFAILYGLGLRVGEVSRLCDHDVDFDRQILFIRSTKFNKSRLVPFGPRMSALLATYMDARRPYRGSPASEGPLFSFAHNQPISPYTVTQMFHRLVPQLKLAIPTGVSPPRLHDLRHSFAVGTLLRWYRSGIDPGSRLLALSTFLGHVSPESTAVYLTITSDLLQQAGERFERFATPLFTVEAP